MGNIQGMYARRKPGTPFWEMRQERYKADLAAGIEHPHDVCAVANSKEELERMCAPYWPDADYSEKDV